MGSPALFDGVYVPVITPLSSNGEVDYQALAAIAQRYLSAGVRGLVALGTTGEPATLGEEEKRRVVEVVAGECVAAGRQFICGAGTNSTAASIELVRAAQETRGLSAVLSVVPYYTRPSEAGIVEHFNAVADASQVPVIVYNIPYRTGRGLGAESLLELADHPNIAGVKQSVGGIDADTVALMAARREGFSVLSGEDAFIYPLLALGGTGTIAAASHVCTEVFVEMVASAQRGDWVRARAIHELLLPLAKVLFAEPNPAVTKAVLHRQGLIPTDSLRLPMTSASQQVVDEAVEIADKVAKDFASL